MTPKHVELRPPRTVCVVSGFTGNKSSCSGRAGRWEPESFHAIFTKIMATLQWNHGYDRGIPKKRGSCPVWKFIAWDNMYFRLFWGYLLHEIPNKCAPNFSQRGASKHITSTAVTWLCIDGADGAVYKPDLYLQSVICNMSTYLLYLCLYIIYNNI